MLTPARIYEEELLDAGEGTDEDVAKGLNDLRRINRFLGGSRVVLNALTRLVSGARLQEFTLLDIGTGSADIPMAVADWCTLQKIRSQIVALDLSERNLRVARTRLGISPKVKLVRADAMRLPFPDHCFDYVTASLFLHHFREDDIVRLLAEFARVARRAIIVNDLVRNLIPYYFIRLIGPVFTRSYLTHNDGPVSVLRALTADELRRLAGRAGLRRFEVKRSFPYRLSMIAEVSGQWSVVSGQYSESRV
ncbi:MAG TPA: methyltransferase domain-containing protein [Blastocatellia bacterium]|nr:methyltransferase domain-containing protein [Blastocatellia bacterium]